MVEKGLAASAPDNTSPVTAKQEPGRRLKVAMPPGMVDELTARAREKGFANLSDAVRTVLAAWARRDEVADAVSATPVSVALEASPREER